MMTLFETREPIFADLTGGGTMDELKSALLHGAPFPLQLRVDQTIEDILAQINEVWRLSDGAWRLKGYCPLVNCRSHFEADYTIEPVPIDNLHGRIDLNRPPSMLQKLARGGVYEEFDRIPSADELWQALVGERRAVQFGLTGVGGTRSFGVLSLQAHPVDQQWLIVTCYSLQDDDVPLNIILCNPNQQTGLLYRQS